MHALRALPPVEKGIVSEDCRRAPVRLLPLIAWIPAQRNGYRLGTWNGEGRIRLSADDGPSARSFIDDDNGDEEASPDDEPLPSWAPSGLQEPPVMDGHARAEAVPLQNPLPVPPKP